MNHVVSQVGTNIFEEHTASMVRGDEKRVLRQCRNPEEQIFRQTCMKICELVSRLLFVFVVQSEDRRWTLAAR
jgi:hypothetical protein